MLIYSAAELCALFFIYGFAGWILETVYATIRHRSFSNRGIINGPFCVTYGVGAILVTVTLQELTGVWLFVCSMIYTAVVEWVGGHLSERLLHRRLWNYENVRGNMDGYICIPASLLWGALGYVIIRWGNEFFVQLIRMAPHILTVVILWVLLGILAADLLGTHFLLQQRGRHLEKWSQSNKRIATVTAALEKRIVDAVEKRVQRAYPQARSMDKAADEEGVFAAGCGFYKLVWILVVGSLLGDITETLFCRVRAGVWMSRSSLVWGPFSIVWGMAMVMATVLLYRSRNKGSFFIFSIGTFLGGAYEYLCSVITEIAFGTVFWDYSAIPFNLGGRINLLYCFFWGLASVVWIQIVYPVFSRLVEKIPMKPGKVITWLLAIFMVCDMAVSAAALVRYQERSEQIPAANVVQEMLDTYYGDAVMERIYPNAISVK